MISFSIWTACSLLEFDWEQDRRNMDERGISLAAATQFEWRTALLKSSYQRGEPQFRAFGMLKNRLHVLVFTPHPSTIRILSLRKANRREIHEFNQTQTPLSTNGGKSGMDKRGFHQGPPCD